MKSTTKRWAGMLVATVLLVAPVAQGTVVAGQESGVAQVATAQTLNGMVTNERGQALPGARVEVFAYGTGRVAVTVTEADGTFALALPNSAQTLFWVRAWAAGYDTTEQVWTPGRDLSMVQLVLPSLYKSLQGQVREASGLPVAGASVGILLSGQGLVAETKSNQAGRFHVDNLLSDRTYQVIVQASGYVATVREWAGTTGDGSLVTTLEAGAGVVSGQIVDKASSRPLVGATVTVERADLGALSTVLTDGAGNFSMQVPASSAEPFSIRVTQKGYAPYQTEPFRLGTTGKVWFTGDSRLQLTPVSTTLMGRVIGENGNGVGKVDVWLERQGYGIVERTESDSEGYFHWTDLGTDDGQYRVRALPNRNSATNSSGGRYGAAAATAWFTLDAGGRTEQNVNLTLMQRFSYGTARIVGTAVDSVGKAVPGANAELYRVGEGLIATSVAHADGTFVFENVEAMPSAAGPDSAALGYIVQVTANGYAPYASQVFPLNLDEESVLTARLHKAKVTLVAKAVDGDGRPLPGADVRVIPVNGTAISTGKTDASGMLRVQAQAHQQYWIETTLDGYRATGLTQVVPSPDTDTVVRLTLKAAGATDVTGTVTDEAGRGIAGAVVTGTGSAEQTYRAVTDSEGRYRIAAIPVGERLIIRADAKGMLPGATTEPLAVRVGLPLEADLTLHPAGGRVIGRVADETGRGTSGVTVELWQSGVGKVGTTVTSKGGTYEFEVPVAPDSRFAVSLADPSLTYRNAGYFTPPRLFWLRSGETTYVYLQTTSP